MSKTLSWDELECPLQPWIKTAIDIMGFDSMTPVQASTIPMFAGNKDVIVESVTGSGKTIAFVIPILERMIAEKANSSNLKKGHFYSLIVTPTRELSTQIHFVFQKFLDHYPSKEYPIRSQLLIGTNQSTVRDDLMNFLENRPQILVGTPGRIFDFLQMPAVQTKSCGVVVLDEADRLLDMGFFGEVEKILRILPKQRRTGLFSATIGSNGNRIFKTGLRNPFKITVNSKTKTPVSLRLFYTILDPDAKMLQLLSIMNNYPFKKCIVYFPTCISVTYFYSFLQYLRKDQKLLDEEIQFFSLHGKLQTSSRQKTLDSFSELLGQTVLLTTDVAARGIDISDVDLVIQLDPPSDSNMFLHRCGRAGRANNQGRAITFLNRGREEDYIPFLAIKGVELKEFPPRIIGLPSKEEFYEIFKKWILTDRVRYDLSVRSYVAFIKSYMKHSASSIFRLQSLDYIGLAKMYGVIRLPRMPEIDNYFHNNNTKDGWIIDSPIDMEKFGYQDKKREEKRLELMRNAEQFNEKKRHKAEARRKNTSWSNKLQSKRERSQRKAKMVLKKEQIEKQIAEGSDSEEDLQEDWKETIIQNKRRKQNQSSTVTGTFEDL